ncbi:hypothetical protein [Nitrosomonas sp.]|uniref:hypothetical protein n=1 Tax=Nitrosomonas sp. TaxID=42353 RepID=UPI0025E6ACE4|nr:hypothetical protein [Nitrosomonas sp.]MBV6447083.1 hypothetical protein [Nitrosomonas sp.]
MGAGEQRAVVDVDEETKALLMPRLNISKSALVDEYGSPILIGPSIYTYGSHPQPWDVPFNTKAVFHPNMLDGSNPVTTGIEVISDSYNWKPSGRGQLLYSSGSTAAAPLVSGLAGNGSTEVNMYGGSLNPMTIPANLPYKGCRFRFQAALVKTGGTASWDIYCRVGTSSTYTNNDSFFALTGVNLASGRTFWVDTEFTVTSVGDYGANPSLGGSTAAKFTTKNWLTRNGQGTSPLLDQSTIFSTIAKNYIHINIKGNAADTFALIDYSLEWLP